MTIHKNPFHVAHKKTKQKIEIPLKQFCVYIFFSLQLVQAGCMARTVSTSVSARTAVPVIMLQGCVTAPLATREASVRQVS